MVRLWKGQEKVLCDTQPGLDTGSLKCLDGEVPYEVAQLASTAVLVLDYFAYDKRLHITRQRMSVELKRTGLSAPRWGTALSKKQKVTVTVSPAGKPRVVSHH